MDVRRFLPRQEVASKNPVGSANPQRSEGREGGVCLISHSTAEKRFFWLLFFAQAKNK
jgi:hypothetical protein